MNLFRGSLTQRRRTCGSRGAKNAGVLAAKVFAANTFAANTFAAIFVVVFLVMGCSFDDNEHEDRGFIPVGEWITSFDSYTITNDSINYLMAGSEWEGIIYPDTILNGSIEKAVDFSNDSGILIIKITEATFNTVDKYTGVYYSEYKSSSVKISTAIGPGPDYLPVEANNLSEALSLFTVDNASTHVLTWGVYTK